MIKLGIIYLLLMTSIAVPPLLLVSVPLAIWQTKRVLQARRVVLDLGAALEDERREDAIVKFFR